MEHTISSLRRAKGFQVFAALLAVSLVIVLSSARAQEVVHMDGSSGSLQNRHAAALDLAPEHETSGGFWIGYTIERQMCENCFMGMFDDRLRQRLSLNELIHDVRLDDDFSGSQSVHDVAARALKGHEMGAGRTVTKTLAILAIFEKGSNRPYRIEMSNMNLYFDFKEAPLLWLGPAENAESLALLEGLWDSEAPEDVRKSVLYAMGAHDEPQWVVPFLGEVLRSAEVTDLRKAAAYSLGNQSTEPALKMLSAQARSADVEVAKACVYSMGNMDLPGVISELAGIVEGGPSFDMEVRKAAVYAMGNLDSDEARTILLTLIEGLQ